MIARNVSRCSKTEGGADAVGAFTSVLRTLMRRVEEESLVAALCNVFSGAPAPLLPDSEPLINYKDSSQVAITSGTIPLLQSCF